MGARSFATSYLLSNDSAFVCPTLSATCATSAVPARDTKPAPSDVTSAVTGRPSRITFKVNLQARIRTFDKPKDPCSVGRFRAPARRGRGRYCTLRANAPEQPGPQVNNRSTGGHKTD